MQVLDYKDTNIEIEVNCFEQLRKKIEHVERRCAYVGLGYVRLPLAVRARARRL